VISGVGTGDDNVTRHPPGIPGITCHAHITGVINIVTTYHNLKRNSVKREEGRGVGVNGTPLFLLLFFIFPTTQL
jgi:hypothetical protein